MAPYAGSNSGGRVARVQLVTPDIREFDRRKAHHRITVCELLQIEVGGS
jgi:hypothetical protein